jgi:hypothetical protein
LKAAGRRKNGPDGGAADTLECCADPEEVGVEGVCVGRAEKS